MILQEALAFAVGLLAGMMITAAWSIAFVKRALRKANEAFYNRP